MVFVARRKAEKGKGEGRSSGEGGGGAEGCQGEAREAPGEDGVGGEVVKRTLQYC